MIHDPVERGHDKYNSNFSLHSLSTSRKHKWQAWSSTGFTVTNKSYLKYLL